MATGKNFPGEESGEQQLDRWQFPGTKISPATKKRLPPGARSSRMDLAHVRSFGPMLRPLMDPDWMPERFVSFSSGGRWDTGQVDFGFGDFSNIQLPFTRYSLPIEVCSVALP